MIGALAALLLGCLAHLPQARGHGRLIEPPSRASAWRYGFSTPPNYNDHELYCGGFSRQWNKNGGKCGVCGDAWDLPPPRPHEYGGPYGQGVIVRKYGVGAMINIRVELTANHHGYFEFRLCPDYANTTQECLDQYVLKMVKPQDDVTMGYQRYYPKDGNKIYEMKYMLPNLSCPHCVLQWRYIAGNNWGNCPDGTGAVGCGPQEEFRACADIAIEGTAPSMWPTSPLPTVFPTRKPTKPITTELPPVETEATYSPVTSILVAVLSLFCIVLLLTLLYIYYYQVGRIKAWLKGKSVEKTAPPVPPPRTKRRSQTDSMENVTLDADSLA